MGPLAALALQAAITAMQHATEISQLIATATAEGRDITQPELDGLRGRAVAAIDALEAAKKP